MGRRAAEIRLEKPAKARQKDVEARWTLQRSEPKARAGGAEERVALATPLFGHKSHVSIDWMHGIVRRQIVTDAARHDRGRLREGLIQRANTARDVGADSAYRSAENEAWLAAHGMTSRIHRKKPRGRPMPRPTRRANARRAAVRARIEHVLAHQKARMGLVIRTIGLAPARAAVTPANIAHNMARWRWLTGRPAPA